jgi:hypothetical protein
VFVGLYLLNSLSLNVNSFVALLYIKMIAKPYE